MQKEFTPLQHILTITSKSEKQEIGYNLTTLIPATATIINIKNDLKNIQTHYK